ncbi:hypothetical protein BWQ96_00235 [Gracilariopsis chorda]|uniref:Uncharacterized protein n=1 Tax=Gracilariopsis chorda TaxID=448386 RepID=A0A2V3J6N9_9FLOR|nr:hypothetical protein BWQ96_00235 [Gracilariopsis chorda]|eukprot:PXF50075.1 hypothetical protein BWQ96_00235 [Gracilariopsis chorda]
MNTGCTSLDSAKARTELEKSFSDSGLFERTLVDCFVDGSRAAAETASHFLRNQATSQSAAEYISNGIKSLPTAVASTNAPPLAAVAAFIALGFDGQVCNAPLRSFCFSNHEVKRAAIEAVIRILSLKLSLSGGDCDSLLQKAAKFFGDVSAELSEVELSFMVREITGITSHAYEENQGQLLSLLLDLGAGNSPCLEQGSSHRLSTRFESFYAVEIANSAFDLESITAVVLHCLCRGIEFGDASAIRAVWKSHKDWVIEVFESTHCDMFLAALCTIAGQQAWQGNIDFCQDVLDALRQALNCVMSTSSKVSEVIVLFVSGICVSIGSIGMAAGAEELAKNCASIIRLAKDSSSGNACPAEECLDGMSQAVCESVKRKWPVSSLVFAVLRKLLLVWKYPSFTEAWLKEDFVVLLESRTKLYVKEDLQYGVVDSLSKVENAENLMPVGRTVLRASAEPVALPIVGTLITLMSHKHPRVRLSSLELLQKVRKSSLLVFFLPSIMVLMEKESNGFIAAKYLREVLTCPGFMSRTETSNVVLSTLLRLSGAHINSENSWDRIDSAGSGFRVCPIGVSSTSYRAS